MNDIISVPGLEKVLDWFGYMPNFHDAEVKEIILRRSPEYSLISVHCWRNPGDIDNDGVCRRDKEAIVVFRIDGISQISLGDWNHQNVLSKVDISKVDDGYRLDILASFGIDGFIVADNISISIGDL